MEEKLTWREAIVLRYAVKKKLKDFHRAGYLNVVEKEIWDYATERLWKRETVKSLKERKQHIKNITTNDFFDFQQLQAQIQNVENFNFADIQDLL